MSKPKNCFGRGDVGARLGGGHRRDGRQEQRAASVSARNRRTGMDLPSRERPIQYQIANWRLVFGLQQSANESPIADVDPRSPLYRLGVPRAARSGFGHRAGQRMPCS